MGERKMATCNDNCGKVSVKIAGFTGCLAAPGALASLSASSIFGDSVNVASNIAYVAAKCVRIACPPVLVLTDTVGALADFLGAQATITTGLDCASVLTSANDTRTRAGIAKMISCCTGECCSTC
jgi:hypothetical protein